MFAAVHLGYTIPTGSVFSSVKKITFAPMDAKAEPVSSNINYKEETLQERIDNHRMVIVTPDGYEYTASYEFTKNLLFSDDDNIEQGREKRDLFKEIAKQLLFNFDDEEDKKKPKHVPDTQQQQDIYNQVARFNNRQVVQNTGLYPFNAIGRVDSGCSGSFVGPNLVLTAAHCIIPDPRSKAYSSNLNFRRAKPCNGQGILHTWRYAAVYYQWLTSNNLDFRYDIGWIITHNPSPVYIHFGSTLPATGHHMQTSGYPASNHPSYCQFISSCTIRRYTLINNVEHTCDIEVGNSGGPIWTYDQSFMYIFAVQSNHVDNFNGFNYGCVITPETERLTRYYMNYI